MDKAEIRWMKDDLKDVVPRVSNSIEGYRKELDCFYTEMKCFDDINLGDVFLKLAGWSARVSEIRGLVSRHDSRLNQAFKTKEVDTFLSEVDRQFRSFSRIQTLRDSEYRMDGKL